MDNVHHEMQEPKHNFKHSLMHVLSRLEHPTITFADIEGFDEVKRQMQDVLDFLKMPQGSHRLEREISQGVLLVGVSGKERRSLVEAVAGTVGIPLISLSFTGLVAAFAALDDHIEYIEGFGSSARISTQDIPSKHGIELTKSILQRFFFQARHKCPCLFLVDDIDAIARLGTMTGREQLLNQLFEEIEGLVEYQRTVVIATASRLDDINRRLLRSDYFKFQVLMDGETYLRQQKSSQWRIAEEQYKNGELLKARVIDCNTGGLIVDVAGIRGFVPVSQVLNLTREEVASGGENQETMAELQRMKDRELQLKIIEINRERRRLILSERLAVQEWRQRRREELLDELKPGEVRCGVVSNIASFGAFVDLGGADGLVHISQLAWGPINHPSEVLYVGQEVEVQILSVDKEKKKIALSIKRAGIDAWATAGKRYKAGQVVTGVITKIAPFGAFARIEDGIEGLIHLSELTPAIDPKQTLYEGQHLQLRILRIEAERRRLGLSMLRVDEPDIREPSKEEISTTNPCPSCQREVQPDWKHCMYCGLSLTKVCPNCGAPRVGLEGARFCFECGCQLE